MDTSYEKIQQPICQRSAATDLSGDFSLPDYQPEIKRLLRIRACVMPPDIYCTSDEAQLSGIINYFVTYTGSDNKLYCAPLGSEFSMTVPLEGMPQYTSGDDIVCTAQMMYDGCSCTGRVSAPRRLTIKCKLSALVKAYADVYPCGEDVTVATADPSTEKLECNIPSNKLAVADSEEITVSEDIIPGMDTEDLRVVCAECMVFISDVSTADGKVVCNGDLNLKITLAEETETDDGEDIGIKAPLIINRKVPFTDAVEIDMDGVLSDSLACAEGYCTQMSVEIEEGRLHAECAVIIRAMAQSRQDMTCVKDIYSTRREGKYRYSLQKTEIPLCSVNSNFTQSDSLSLSELGIDPSAKIIDSCATAVAESMSKADNSDRCRITGKTNFHLILLTGDEYSSAEFSLPFKYECDCRAEIANENICGDASVNVMSCRMRMDGERIGVDAELGVMMRICMEHEEKTLDSVEFSDDIVRRRGEYAVCFPSSDDSLWSVAKRYHSPIATLTVANDLPSSVALDDASAISGVRYLIV